MAKDKKQDYRDAGASQDPRATVCLWGFTFWCHSQTLVHECLAIHSFTGNQASLLSHKRSLQLFLWGGPGL